MAIELERRAAERLIRAGYLDQASRVLNSLLPRIGIGRPARTLAPSSGWWCGDWHLRSGEQDSTNGTSAMSP